MYLAFSIPRLFDSSKIVRTSLRSIRKRMEPTRKIRMKVMAIMNRV